MQIHSSPLVLPFTGQKRNVQHDILEALAALEPGETLDAPTLFGRIGIRPINGYMFLEILNRDKLVSAKLLAGSPPRTWLYQITDLGRDHLARGSHHATL